MEPAPQRSRRRVLPLALLLGILGLGLLLGLGRLRPPVAGAPQGAALPGGRPTRELAYLNLGPQASYVGSAACSPCHAQEQASYGLTPHGRSLSPVKPQDVPPGVLEDEAAGLTYRIGGEDGRLRVREILPLQGGGGESLSDQTLSGVLGAREGLRAYLSEVDGFLVQAPVARVQGVWAMAPGYEGGLNPSFSRPVGRACLRCHAGRIANLEQSPQRIQIQEWAIGCERCHGPGSLHVAHQKQRALQAPAGDDRDASADLTIVNPARLTREGSLQVCGQCHGDQGLAVERPGRRMRDWRPGLPMSGTRVLYRPRTASGEVPVVGYLEQLRSSPCFRASPDLSCTTCHAAHPGPGAAQPVAPLSSVCVSCHGADGCALDAAARHQSVAGGACTACHMPPAEERRPHGVFTSHRIGLHRPQDAPATWALADPVKLVLAGGQPEVPGGEQGRDRALALTRLALWRPTGVRKPLLSPAFRKAVLKEAAGLLQKARKAGPLDPDATVALATLIARESAEEAAQLLEALLAGEAPLREETRVQALAVLARALFELGRTADALAAMERLTPLRRSAEDWTFVAMIARQMQDRKRLLHAVEQVLAIAPQLESSHYLAAEVLSALGQTQRAEHHQRIALQLARHLASWRARRPR